MGTFDLSSWEAEAGSALGCSPARDAQGDPISTNKQMNDPICTQKDTRLQLCCVYSADLGSSPVFPDPILKTFEYPDVAMGL